MADGATVAQVFQKFGVPDMLLWLLSFAVIYGVLSQANVPKGRSTQAILSLVIAFLIILSAPASLAAFIGSLSTSIVLILVGLLVLVVMLEAFGIRHRPIGEKGGKVPYAGSETFGFLAAHPRAFAAAIVVLAGSVFVGAGGLDLLGLQLPTNINLSGTMFLMAIILAVIWLVVGEKQERGD